MGMAIILSCEDACKHVAAALLVHGPCRAAGCLQHSNAFCPIPHAFQQRSFRGHGATILGGTKQILHLSMSPWINPTLPCMVAKPVGDVCICSCYYSSTDCTESKAGPSSS